MAADVPGTGSDFTVAANTGSTTIAVTKPANVVAGDLLIAMHRATTGAPTNSTGWTEIGSSTVSKLYYKIADGSEASSYTFNASSGFGNNRVVLFRVTGADPTTPIAGTPSHKQTGSSTSPTSDTTTASQGDTLLVCILGTSSSATPTATVPSGMTQKINDVGFVTNAVAQLVVGSGATGSKTWTLSPSAISFTSSIAVNSRGGNAGFLALL